jgi:hypothetical protein
VAEPMDYHAFLDDLRKKRALLDQTIAGVEAILGEGSLSAAVAGASTSTEIMVDTFVGLNIPTATVRYLRIVGKPARTTEVITGALNTGGLKCSQASVATVLGRAYASGEGEIRKVARGLWGLKEWYAPSSI